MTTQVGLPGPSSVANLTSDDGSVTLAQYQGGRVVDLSVTAGPTDVTFGGETLGGDVPLPNGTITDLGLSLAVLDGETWLLICTVALVPGVGTAGMGAQVLAQIGNATLLSGAQSANVAITVSSTMDETSISWSGIWAVAGGNDTLKLQAVMSGDDGSAARHDNEFGHPATGFTAIRLVAAA